MICFHDPTTCLVQYRACRFRFDAVTKLRRSSALPFCQSLNCIGRVLVMAHSRNALLRFGHWTSRTNSAHVVISRLSTLQWGAGAVCIGFAFPHGGPCTNFDRITVGYSAALLMDRPSVVMADRYGRQGRPERGDSAMPFSNSCSSRWRSYGVG